MSALPSGDGAGLSAPRTETDRGAPLDRHALYEACVQSPEHLVPLLRAIHGGEPAVLGEDFCGTAALSRAWLRLVPNARAIGLDLDAEVLERAAHEARRAGMRVEHARPNRWILRSDSASEPSELRPEMELVCGDARAACALDLRRCDVVFAGNFSIGELATRADLLHYLRGARARLADGGVFVCDTYGGAHAFRTGAVERVHRLRDGRRIRYTWEQRSADPRDARVVNALHFRVEDRGEIVQELTDAFVYRWRLWSLAELADAFVEAGFTDVRAWRELTEDAIVARAVETSEEFGEDWIVCTSARVARR